MDKKLTINDILNDNTKEVQTLEKAQKKVGRKKSKNAKKNKFLVLFNDILFEKLENEVEKLGISRNEFIEILIKNYFKNNDKKIDNKVVLHQFLSKVDKELIGELNFDYLKSIVEKEIND